MTSAIQPIGLTKETIDCLLPPPKIRSFEWICDNVRTKEGEPFNGVDYPWTEGICDRFDSPQCRELVLDFAARLGKTMTAQSLMVYLIATAPATAMYGAPNETLVKETVKDKYYPMFEACPATKSWVPRKTLRTQTRVDLLYSTMYCGWSGSPTTLADKDPRYKHAGEIDKWTKDSSDEADPIELFNERGIEIPSRKSIYESTPSVSGSSRIENRLLAGTNCRYHVPCPRCGKFQELHFGKGSRDDGGIIFDKRPDGEFDERLAETTARYQCRHCKKEIHEDERKAMIHKGLWVPEGQHLTKTGKLRGTPVYEGPRESFHLSRIYAPTFTFGDIARQFVEVYGNEEKYRNFLNSWLSLTWSPRRSTMEWTDLAKRWCVDRPLHVVPADTLFVTAAVDVQSDHFVYVVMAWNKQSQGSIIDFGTCDSWPEVKTVISNDYEHLDGGPKVRPIITLVDARDGNRTDEIITFCRENNEELGPFVWPSMGGNAGSFRGEPYKRVELNDENRRDPKKKRKTRRLAGFCRIDINTAWYQEWIHACIERRRPNHPNSVSISKDAQSDEDFFSQVLNETETLKKDSTGHGATIWIVVDETIPWDFRDLLRYNRCAADVFTRRAWQRLPVKRRIVAPPAKKPKEDRRESRQKRSFVNKPDRSRFLRNFKR